MVNAVCHLKHYVSFGKKLWCITVVLQLLMLIDNCSTFGNHPYQNRIKSLHAKNSDNTLLVGNIIKNN